jgi:hypothetical protein
MSAEGQSLERHRDCSRPADLDNVVDTAGRLLARAPQIHNHFQLRRHHLNANQYRTARNAAFCTWHDVAEVAPAA